MVWHSRGRYKKRRKMSKVELMALHKREAGSLNDWHSSRAGNVHC